MATACDVKPAELKRIREALGLTQEQLADEVGVHRVTVAKWEAGDRGIPEPVARLVTRIQADRRQLEKDLVRARLDLRASKRVGDLSALAARIERFGVSYRHHAKAIRRAGDATDAGRAVVDEELTKILGYFSTKRL